MNTCPDCERHKLSASMCRNEAYKHAGTPLPWEPEELLQKEYERGFIDGMQEQMRREVEQKVRGKRDRAAAAEREACARMAEAFHQHGYDFTGDLELHDAIRARGQV